MFHGRALAGARLEYKNRFANEKCAMVIKDKSEEVRRKNAMKDEKSKITAVAIEKMIDFYQGNLRDIEHFLKVWAYAKTIGEQESVDENTQGILELAAVVHDISCPLCREKYGNTRGIDSVIVQISHFTFTDQCPRLIFRYINGECFKFIFCKIMKKICAVCSG